MPEVVLDASALLAFLRQEPGADRVASVLSAACISAVNLTETYSKMVEYGKPLDGVVHQIERLCLPVIGYDAEQARIAASLWKPTHPVRLSLGDRACMALALQYSVPAYTTDSEWEKCDVGVKVVRIR